MSATTATPFFWAPEARRYAAESLQISVWGRSWLVAIIVAWAAAAALGFTVSLTVLTIAGFVAALWGVSRPAVGLFGVGVLCTIDALSRVYLLTGGLLRWNSFNYLMIFMLLLYFSQALRLADIHSRLLLAFLSLLVLQLAFTPALMVGLHTVLNVIAPFGILLYFARTGYDRRMLLWLGWINGTLAAVGGAMYFAQMSSLAEMNKNAWSSFPLTAMCSIIMAVLVSPPALHGRLCLLGVINAIWVFLSGSRGGMLMGLICVIFMLHSTRRVGHKVLILAMTPLAAMVLFTVFSDLESTASHRLTMLFDTDRALESRTSGRSDLARAGWRLFIQRPLGVGTGGFGAEFAKMYDPELIFIGKDLGAHSGWVKALAENGIVGICLFTAFVVSFAMAGRRSGVPGAASAGLFVTLFLATAFFSREFHSKGIWLTTASYISFVCSGGRSVTVVAARPRAVQAAS